MAAAMVQEMDLRRLTPPLRAPGYKPYTMHASFSTRTRKEVFDVVVALIESWGGDFTGGHIANAANWFEVWEGKMRDADRVIVFFDEFYKARFTGPLLREYRRCR